MVDLSERPLDELGDKNAEPGSRPWLLYVSNEIRKAYYDQTHTGRKLQDLIKSFKTYNGWQEFGYLTWDQYCMERLRIAADTLEARAAAQMQNAPTLGKHGRPTADEKGDNNNLFDADRGTDPAYLAARIKRDRPDIAARVERGEFRSIRAAAIEAGIVKKMTRYSLPDDPIKAARYLAQRVDGEWIADFVSELVRITDDVD